MLAKAFGQIAGMFRVRYASRARPEHLLPCRFQRLLKARRRHLLAAMDHGKQLPQLSPQPLAVSPGSFTLVRRQA